ncbi:MAG: polysaccharide deacetylase family protein [Gemmatimonadetes bacterium]|nr:polysaccharide deacetylase family protein [Gemmatimonadota bacterium]
MEAHRTVRALRLRSLALSLAIAAGLHERALRAMLARRGNRLVLLFHRVLPAGSGNDFSPPGMVVSDESFSSLLSWLPERFRIVDADTLLADYPAPLSEPSVLITFDDAWSDVALHALPVMKAKGIPGLLFAAPHFIDTGDLFWPERLLRAAASLTDEEFRAIAGGSRPDPADAEEIEAAMQSWKARTEEERLELVSALEEAVAAGAPDRETSKPDELAIANERRISDWRELRVLAENGIEIGSHGYSHALLPDCSQEMIRFELRASKARLEEALGRPVRFVAYPNGDRNDLVRRIAREEGYRFGFSLKGNPLDPFDFPRANLHEAVIRDPARFLWGVSR